MYPPSATGFCDLFGNVWEWTEDHFNGLPGFVTNYLYDDFSSPCFDGNHTMILGGSWISTGDESTRYARFSFRRHFYQHLGFRVARTVDGKRPSPVVRVTSPVYISEVGVQENLIDLGELDSIGLRAIKTPSTCTGIRNDNGDMLSALLSQQYGAESSYTSLLQKIRKLSATVDSSNPSRALVIGCGPGRIAFELTKEFDEVIGCDTSGRCIDYANIMKANAMASHSSSGIVTTATDGFHDDMRHDGVIRIMKDCKPERVVFKQLTWIPRELGQFDVIIVDGLDRMQNKRAWLAVIPSTLKRKEGLAIVVGDGNTPLHGCCDSMATVKHEKCQQANAKTLASVAMSKM